MKGINYDKILLELYKIVNDKLHGKILIDKDLKLIVIGLLATASILQKYLKQDLMVVVFTTM